MKLVSKSGLFKSTVTSDLTTCYAGATMGWGRTGHQKMFVFLILFIPGILTCFLFCDLDFKRGVLLVWLHIYGVLKS
jgi:hypothetical protein